MVENLPPARAQEAAGSQLASKPADGAADQATLNEAPARPRLGPEADPAQSLNASAAPGDTEAPVAESSAALLESDAGAAQGQHSLSAANDKVIVPLTTVPVAVKLGDEFLPPKPSDHALSAAAKSSDSAIAPAPETPVAGSTSADEVSKEAALLQTPAPTKTESAPQPLQQQTPQGEMPNPITVSTKPEMLPPFHAPSESHQNHLAVVPVSHSTPGHASQSPQAQGVSMGPGSSHGIAASAYQAPMVPPSTHPSPAGAPQGPQHQAQQQQQQPQQQFYQQQPQQYQMPQQQHLVMPAQQQSPMMQHQPHMPPPVQPMQSSPMLSSHLQHGLMSQQQTLHSPRIPVMMPHRGSSTPTQQLMPQRSQMSAQPMLHGYQQQPQGTPYIVGMPPANSPPRAMVIQQPTGMISPAFGPGDFGSWAPFTTAQWQELEQQAMVFKYFVAGAQVPQELVHSIRASLAQSMAQGHVVSFGKPVWGGTQGDPEPYRCRRTDGKKWRCSREVVPDQKYCERHMHRGRNRARKTGDKGTPGTSLVSADELGDMVHKSVSQGASELVSEDGARLDRSDSVAGTLSSGGPPPLALPPPAHAVAGDGPGAMAHQQGLVANGQRHTQPSQQQQYGHNQQASPASQHLQQQHQQQKPMQLPSQPVGAAPQSISPSVGYHTQQYMQSTTQYLQQPVAGGLSQGHGGPQYHLQAAYAPQGTVHAPAQGYSQQHPNQQQQRHFTTSSQQLNSGYGQQHQSAAFSSQQHVSHPAMGPGAPYGAHNSMNGQPLQHGQYHVAPNNQGPAPNGQGPQQGPCNNPQGDSQGYSPPGLSQGYSQQSQGNYASARESSSHHNAQSQSHSHQPQFQQGTTGVYRTSTSSPHQQAQVHMKPGNSGQPLVRSESQYSSQSSYKHPEEAQQQQQHYCVQQGQADRAGHGQAVGSSTFSATVPREGHMQEVREVFSPGGPSAPATPMSEAQHPQLSQWPPGGAPTSSGLVATNSAGDKVSLLRVPNILQVERSSGSSITYDQPAMALCM